MNPVIIVSFLSLFTTREYRFQPLFKSPINQPIPCFLFLEQSLPIFFPNLWFCLGESPCCKLMSAPLAFRKNVWPPMKSLLWTWLSSFYELLFSPQYQAPLSLRREKDLSDTLSFLVWCSHVKCPSTESSQPYVCLFHLMLSALTCRVCFPSPISISKASGALSINVYLEWSHHAVLHFTRQVSWLWCWDSPITQHFIHHHIHPQSSIRKAN